MGWFVSETVEQFLARGGQINELPMGYTEYPDGKLPAPKKPKKSDVVETPSIKIKERNKVIRKYFPRPKIPDEKAKLQIDEQVKLLTEFFGEMKHGDKKRFIALTGLAVKTIANAKCGNCKIGVEKWLEIKSIMNDFVFSIPKPKPYKLRNPAETERRNQVIKGKEQAILSGKNSFTAPCKHHGMTKFYIYGNQPPRCAECRYGNLKGRINAKKTDEQKARDERAKYNRDKTNEAVAKGLKTFIGLCANCGYTEMKYSNTPNTKNGRTYRCVECCKKRNTTYNAKRNK